MNPLGPTNQFVPFAPSQIEQSIAARFEQQARLYPNQIAVRTPQARLTYAELNQAANRLARAIVAQLGVTSATPVALLLEQGAELIVAIIAALKAGRFYTPLDSTFSAGRNAALIADAQPDLILADTVNVATARQLAGSATAVLNVAEINTDISGADLGLTIAPDALAYILYTSGSTGQPKGVLQTQRTVLHNVMKYTNGLHIAATDRLTLLSSCSFGASVSDVFGALLNGASLHPFNIKRDGLHGLAAWIDGEEVTIYHSVPTVFRHFVATFRGAERFPNLRVIKLGGEPVTRGDVELYRRHFAPGCLLHVGFGATEMNIIRQFFCNHQTTFSGEVAPVGYAVADTEIVLLDEHGASLDDAGPGEIAIRSRYLSPGYWRRPDLTATAFLEDARGNGERMYRTGDVGSLLADGCLVHLGRNDGQLKIRGYRVEVAEVEAALSEFVGIREAAVVGVPAENGDQRLVACVVAVDGADVNAAALRARLLEKLPDYMVPTTFLPVHALPQTANGKVDRLAVIEIARANGSEPRAVTPARDELELRLVALWEDFLSVRPIGVRDNFFDLGGHSLLAVRLLAEIKIQWGHEWSVTDLIQSPTIELQARRLRQEKGDRAESLLVPFQTAGAKPPVFCIHLRGDDAAAWEFARSLGAAQPCYGFQPHGADGRRPPGSVEEMAADYLRQVLSVQPTGPYYLGGYSFGGFVAYEMAQQLRERGETVALLFMLDTTGKRFRRELPKLETLPTEARRHWTEFAELSAVEKWNYVAERIQARFRHLELKVKAKMLVCRSAHALTGRVPERLRPFYVYRFNSQLKRRYVPQPYPGRVVFFRAEKYDCDPHLTWEPLVAGGIEIHTVPCEHHEMFLGAHGQLLATQLRQCVDVSHAASEAQQSNA